MADGRQSHQHTSLVDGRQWGQRRSPPETHDRKGILVHIHRLAFLSACGNNTRRIRTYFFSHVTTIHYFSASLRLASLSYDSFLSLTVCLHISLTRESLRFSWTVPYSNVSSCAAYKRLMLYPIQRYPPNRPIVIHENHGMIVLNVLSDLHRHGQHYTGTLMIIDIFHRSLVKNWCNGPHPSFNIRNILKYSVTNTRVAYIKYHIWALTVNLVMTRGLRAYYYRSFELYCYLLKTLLIKFRTFSKSM